MAIFESLFDVLYLSLVIALGFRLVLEGKKEAKLFGLMAILLGLGDSFHLIPRVVSHLSTLGFEGHSWALSWGQFITSITMTIFYLLYYFYYSKQSGDKDKRKLVLVLFLVIARIALVLFPQNNWGQANGNYMFGIYRNIPFAILGLLLIIWSFKERKKEGLSYMWLLISLSFLFYIPVVLWSQKFPLVGALMMPKTLAYLLIVVMGYRYFISDFKVTNLLGLATSNLIMGLIAGAFYREFTKFYSFTSPNHLQKLHVHILVLGFIFMTVLYMITKKYGGNRIKTLKKPLYIYLSGFTLSMACMMIIGIFEVVSQNSPTINSQAIAGISGLGHILLASGLIWLMIRVYKEERLIKNI